MHFHVNVCLYVMKPISALLIVYFLVMTSKRCTHSIYKGALSRGFCCVQVNSVLKSLLSTFTHVTYKGVLSRGFCCVQVNSVL